MATGTITDASGSAISFATLWGDHGGLGGDIDHPVLFEITGTWDGATVTLEHDPNGGSAFVNADSQLACTADTSLRVYLNGAASYQLALADLGASTNLTYTLTRT